MDVHLRGLRYFVAVAEELHFTHAAERLFVSQPALSRQIAKLETDLRVTLFDRDRRVVTLTGAGQALLDDARAILTEWDTAQRRLSDAAAAANAVLRIGMQTSVGRGIIGHLIDGLSARRPGWSVQIRQVSWDDPTAGLASHDNDVAFCWLPLNDPGPYAWTVVASEPRLIALAVEHPLAAMQSIRFEQVERIPLVALPPEAGRLRDHWLAQDHRTSPAPVATVARNADEAMEAVANGIGAVLISSGNARLYARPGITFVEVADLQPAHLALVWRRADHRDVIRDLIALAALDQPAGAADN